jgi:hypothetical protein
MDLVYGLVFLLGALFLKLICMDNKQQSKTIAYANGDLLNLDKVSKLLLDYWSLSAAERRSVRNMINTYPEKYRLPLPKK